MILKKGKREILNRLYLVVGLLLVVFVVILGKVFQIQFVEGDHYRAIADKQTVKLHTIKARRGNIYAEDGSLLATSVTKYDIAIDPMVASSKLFNENIDALSDSIYRVFGARNKYYYANKLTALRKKEKRYMRLINNLSYDEYKRIKGFPILSKGRFRGGLIVSERLVREHPLGKIAERTIGGTKEITAVGLEGAYSRYLGGIDGSVLSVKLQKNAWKPLTPKNQIDPKDGADIYSTIDVHIQDVAHFALLRQLEKFEADHGSVVVMEVKTGKVKAIVNLARNSKGKYYERFNYAISESVEPGSTFKLPVLIAALEDGVVDTSKVIDTGKGKYKVYNRTIRDSHHGGFGKISLAEVFTESSNVGMAKMVMDNYMNYPSRLMERLYSMGIDKKVNISILGEKAPFIPVPGSDKWSGISLPWMAYGYGVHMTPLQILTFYNAIANDGVQMKPYFISKIKDEQEKIKTVHPQVINSRICSEKNVRIAQALLEGVVDHGTGVGLKMKGLKIAGKTGTTQVEYWKEVQYRASFVGYFPADNPKYSAIVVVNKPNKKKGYYGAQVAAPVFKEIAVKIYHDGPEVQDKKALLEYPELLRDIKNSKTAKVERKGLMPNVKGIPARDAIYLLENMGLKVTMSGSGKVVKQSISAGRRVKKNNRVNLVLM